MTVQEIKTLVCKDTVAAYRAGIVGDKPLEAAISHRILMVLQSRQTDPDQDVIPVGFDICQLRLDTFEKIAGRQAL